MSVNGRYERHFDTVQTFVALLMGGFLILHAVLYIWFQGDANSVFLYFALALSYIWGIARLINSRLTRLCQRILELERRLQNVGKSTGSSMEQNKE